jgi:hypothetical protein
VLNAAASKTENKKAELVRQWHAGLRGASEAGFCFYNSVVASWGCGFGHWAPLRPREPRSPVVLLLIATSLW